MSLSLRRVSTGSAAVPIEGIVKGVTLTGAQTASRLIEDAMREAQCLLDDARVRSERECRELQTELQRKLWQQAADYAAAVDRDWNLALEKLEGSMADVLVLALTRLVESVPREDRLRACVRQLLRQAPRPDTGILHVSSADESFIADISASIPWPLQPNDDVPSGCVRLVSAHGAWEFEIDAALEKLAEAIGAHVSATGGKHVAY